MSQVRISGGEMFDIFALGAFLGVAVVSLVLAACGGFWGAAEVSLVAVVALVAEAGYVGHCVLERGRAQPSLNSTKAGTGDRAAKNVPST